MVAFPLKKCKLNRHINQNMQLTHSNCLSFLIISNEVTFLDLDCFIARKSEELLGEEAVSLLNLAEKAYVFTAGSHLALSKNFKW